MSSLTPEGVFGILGAMTNTENTLSECQHCSEPVSYSSHPADAGFAAFTHDSTNTVECPQSPVVNANAEKMAAAWAGDTRTEDANEQARATARSLRGLTADSPVVL